MDSFLCAFIKIHIHIKYDKLFLEKMSEKYIILIMINNGRRV